MANGKCPDVKTNATQTATSLYSTDPLVLQSTIEQLYGTAFGHDGSSGTDRVGLPINTAFGEILPFGVSTILNKTHLDAASTTFLADLGMGNGKVAIQAFLSYANLKKVVGVELVRGRFTTGLTGLRALHKALPGSTLKEIGAPNTTTATLTTKDGRVLEFRNDNLLNCTDCLEAGVIFAEIIVNPDGQPAFRKFLSRMKKGAKLLTYQNVESYFPSDVATSPFQPFAVSEYYPASWGSVHFHLNTKVA